MTEHLYDPNMIELAKDALGWRSNPFAGNQAFVSPPEAWCELLADAVSRVLFFQSGLGQTVALTNWLKEHNRSLADRESDNARFVVVINHSDLESVPADVLETVAKSLAEYIADQNKNHYDETSEENKRAICRVILSAFPDVGTLEGFFAQVQVDRMTLRKDLITHIRNFARSESVEDTSSPSNLLKNAWPYGYFGLTLAIDLDTQGLVNGRDLPRQTRQLLKFMEELPIESGTCIKLGIPREPPGFSTRVRRMHMETWGRKDLERLLRFRLNTIKYKGKSVNSPLQAIASRDCSRLLDDFLLDDAQGFPRRLLHRGNQLLELYGTRLYGIKKVKDGSDPDDLDEDEKEKARIGDEELEQLRIGPVDFCIKMLEELTHYVREEDQLRHLCLYLGVAYNQLVGGTVPARLLALLQSYREHEDLETLLNKCIEHFPTANWPKLPPELRACP